MRHILLWTLWTLWMIEITSRMKLDHRKSDVFPPMYNSTCHVIHLDRIEYWIFRYRVCTEFKLLSIEKVNQYKWFDDINFQCESWLCQGDIDTSVNQTLILLLKKCSMIHMMECLLINQGVEYLIALPVYRTFCYPFVNQGH